MSAALSAKHAEALDQLRALREERDLEVAHIRADRVLCELLQALGLADVVEAWKGVPKYYA